MTDQERGEVRWRLEAPGHTTSRGAGRAGAEEGADVEGSSGRPRMRQGLRGGQRSPVRGR
jgi:hypothetical protein